MVTDHPAKEVKHLPSQPHDRLGDEEIAAILRLAAELQAQGATETPGLTVDDLARLAPEAGIDEKYVRQAAVLLTAKDEELHQIWSVLGTTPTIRIIRSVPPATRPSNTRTARLEAVLERRLGVVRRKAIFGNALAWDSITASRRTQVTVVPTTHEIRVIVDEDLSGLTRNLFIAVVVVFGVLGGGLAFALAGWLTGSPNISLATAGIILTLSVVPARVLQQNLITRRTKKLNDLADALIQEILG